MQLYRDIGRAGRSLLTLLVATLVASLLAASSAWALDKPTGPVLLTVDGKISETNTDTGAAAFDAAMLAALGVTLVRTETPWTEGAIAFEGVLLRDLLRAVGAEGAALRAVAINDYAVEIPVADAEAYDLIVATKRDGEMMSVRDKGPLWVIYPWSDKPELVDEVHHSRSIWQLTRITVQ